MKRRILWISVVAIISMALGYAYKEYNRKPANLAKHTAALSLDAVTLATDYTTNEDSANKIYLGKVLEVRGKVVQKTNESLVLGNAAAEHNVSCTLDTAYYSTLLDIKEGQTIIIRGVCTGFLIDVELNRAVIVP